MADVNKYLKHAMQNKLVKFYQQYTNVIKLPVCPKCERIAMRDAKSYEVRAEYEMGDVRRTSVTCPHCGFHGYTSKTTDMYVKEGLYK